MWGELIRRCLPAALLPVMVVAALADERGPAARDPERAGAAEPSGFADRAAALVEPYLDAGLFSGAILVAKDGAPIFRRAYGLANREWGVANTPDTHFRVGSITKQFTAAAVLQLAEQRRLGLDDPIRRYHPDAPAAWERVTVRTLLNHTSGIVNYTALTEYLPAISRIERSPRAIVALTETYPLLFEPGTRFEYSNTGYVLLGMVVEAVTGRAYADHLRAAILAPLGLDDTGYDDASAILPRRAAGYRFGRGAWRNAAPMASSIAYAAGGLYATVDDLLAWDRALFGGAVISAASRAAMFDDGGRGYGLGWYVGAAHGHRLYSHGGAVSGFLSITDWYPEDGLAVIVLANTETAPTQTIARALGALYFGVGDPFAAIALEDVILDRYVGAYQLGPHVLTIVHDGAHLLASVRGEPALRLVPESDHTFVAPSLPARVTFDTEPDGRPSGLVLHQDGRDTVAPRIEGSAGASPQSPPRTAP